MQYFCILFKAALEDAAAANGLPQKLVPTETDREGNEILNPEEPVEFFQLGGNVTARRHLRQLGRGLLLCSGALTVLAVRKKKSNKQPIIPPRSESVLNAADKKEPVRMKLRTGSFLLAFAVSQGVSAVLHSIRHPTPAWPHRRWLWHPSHRSLPRSPWHNPGSAPRRPP